ncbi:glycosyl transferase family 11 domain-containing protein [Ditylenchus destructor]|uniref:Glycosyl transferase family 11 domain-containing protein n=1 Tax=Ditylenchus destructor TaxID=166010 RepID=A0AAD4R274_9BILA|nr:glycosyl transferase family 11 domain-containing protein [Ditylenchus destructor]
MCKFAALYAMGQVLRRTPAYLIEEMTMRNNEQEIAALFPMFYGMVHYFTRQNLSVRQFELAKTCCDYQDPVVGNKSHKLCIHVRTGDFISWHWESKPNTTSEAIKRIAQNFAEKGIDYSLVFLGQDKEFFKQVNLNKQQKRNVFVTPKDISRGDEMCLGATTCDSLLLTAHISTYGFWIGYLMPDNSQIYYIANFKTSKLHTPGQFPPEWVHFDL